MEMQLAFSEAGRPFPGLTGCKGLIVASGKWGILLALQTKNGAEENMLNLLICKINENLDI